MKGAAALLAALTLVRLLVAATTPLSADEAYYWTWSKALAPGYLDHPPAVALAIRIGTAVAGDDPLGVRLLAPILALLGSPLLAGAARDLLGLDRRGQRAAVILLNATLMVGAGAVIMTPDTPLLFFWTAALWTAGRALRTGADSWLILCGLATGLAFDSKYTGFLLVPELAVWLLRERGARALLSSWQVLLAAAVCLLAVLPVVVWNANHHFASFLKQGGRAGDIHPARAMSHLAELLGGQLGLATPLIAVLACAGLAQTARRALRRDPGASLVALATLLPAGIFVFHAVGDRVQANWPSVLYPGAALAAALIRGRIGWRNASALGIAVTLLVYLQATVHPISVPARLDIISNRFDGWGVLAREITRDNPGLPVAADDYALASELAWNRAGPQVVGTDRRWWFTRLPRAPLVGPVLLVRSDRGRAPPDASLWRSAARAEVIARVRGRDRIEQFTLYRGTARRGTVAVQLPIPSPDAL